MATIEIVGLAISAAMLYSFIGGVAFVFLPADKMVYRNRALLAWLWPAIPFAMLFNVPISIKAQQRRRQMRVVK